MIGRTALAGPTGFADGLPTGVRIVAGRFGEDLRLEVGEAIERVFATETPIDPRA